MKARRCVLLTILLSAGTLALAHGDYEHVMGTVTKLSDNLIVIQTTANDVVEVATSPDTKFLKADTAVESRELKVGDRVVIHAKKASDGKLVAHTVQIGAAKAPATSH